MGSQIERQQDNNACLSYWLSNTVTLLYLLQRNIKPASGGSYNSRLRQETPVNPLSQHGVTCIIISLAQKLAAAGFCLVKPLGASIKDKQHVQQKIAATPAFIVLLDAGVNQTLDGADHAKY